MRKSLLSINIIGIVLVVVLLILSYSFDNVVTIIADSLIFVVIFGSLIVSLIIRNRVNNKTRNIQSAYIQECDPLKYITLAEQDMKSVLLTKMAKYMFAISKIDFMIEAGELEKAKASLDSLIDSENEFNDAVRALYYKSWIMWFLMNDEFIKADELLSELEKLTQQQNNIRIQQMTFAAYMNAYNKYNVFVGRSLDMSETYFTTLVNDNRGKVYIVVGMYYLGIIALDNGDYKNAINKLGYVKSNGNKLIYQKKAEEILNKLNNANN